MPKEVKTRRFARLEREAMAGQQRQQAEIEGKQHLAEIQAKPDALYETEAEKLDSFVQQYGGGQLIW